MGERDDLGRLLRGEDAGQAGHRERVPLRELSGRERGERRRVQPDSSRAPRPAARSSPSRRRPPSAPGPAHPRAGTTAAQRTRRAGSLGPAALAGLFRGARSRPLPHAPRTARECSGWRKRSPDGSSSRHVLLRERLRARPRRPGRGARARRARSARAPRAGPPAVQTAASG